MHGYDIDRLILSHDIRTELHIIKTQVLLLASLKQDAEPVFQGMPPASLQGAPQETTNKSNRNNSSYCASAKKKDRVERSGQIKQYERQGPNPTEEFIYSASSPLQIASLLTIQEGNLMWMI